MAIPMSEDRMARAIEAFEEKQRKSNILYNKVLEERKNKFAKDLKYESWEHLVNQHNLASLEDLLAVDVGQSDKGTRPSVSPEQQHTFLTELHKAINEGFDHNAPGYQPVELPRDYGLLLNITDGLHDTDLRGSGVCGIDGIQNVDTLKMTGNYNIKELPWAKVYWEYGWTLSTGFCLGFGNPSRQQWLAYYYCSRTEYPGVDTGDIKDSEREWRWRVFYKEPERYRHSFLEPMIFNDLIEWLEFYQEWWERESRDYPEWRAKMLQEVNSMYSSGDEEDDPVEQFCYESSTIKDLFKHSTKEVPPITLDEADISTALKAYRRTTTASHRALFTGRSRYLENDESLNNQQRLDLRSPYFRAQRWGRKGYGGSITSPSELLILPGQEGYVDLGVNDDGTLRPATADRREGFLRELQRLIGESFQGLVLPQEYTELLTLTDAKSDVDFIYSRRAGMNGVCGGLPSRWQMAHDLSQWEDQGWRVLGSWTCAVGDMSTTQLLFCQKAESYVQEERDLKWRVYHSDRENLDGTFYGSIAQWLSWRTRWFERLPAGWETVSPPLLPEDVEYGKPDDSEEDQENLEED